MVLEAPLGPGPELLFLLKALGGGSGANLRFLDLDLGPGPEGGSEGPAPELSDWALGRLAGLGE